MLKLIISLNIFLFCCASLKLKLAVQGNDAVCLYQVLQINQKYSLETQALDQLQYQINITHIYDGAWRHAIHRKIKKPLDLIKLHKLASIGSTYQFCIHNTDPSFKILHIQVDLRTGYQIMDFEMLPNNTDHQIVQRELKWMNKQADQIIEATARVSGLRGTSEQIYNFMNAKLLGFAITGVLTVLAVNFVFYKRLKHMFKERKLI